MARGFTAADTEYFRSTSVSLSAFPVSFACWALHSDASPASDVLIQIQDEAGPSNWARLGLTANGDVRIRSQNAGGGTQAIVGAGSPMVQNTWHHCAGTMTDAGGGSAWAYMDGTSGSEVTGTMFFPAGIDSITIGYANDSTGSDPWNGNIFWPAVWAAVLSADDITALRKGVPPWVIKPESLIHFAPLAGSDGNERDWMTGSAFTETGTVDSVEGPHVSSVGGIIVPSFVSGTTIMVPTGPWR